MQTFNQKHRCQLARWKYLRLTQVRGRADLGAKHQRSGGDPVASLHHEQGVQFETGVGVGL